MDFLKLLNPQALLGVFGKVPEFVNSELMEVQLKRDGPTLFVRLMTNLVVKKRPARWMDKWDVIYIEMSFFGVGNMSISGWGDSNLIGQFEIVERGSEVFLNLRCGSQTQIRCSYDWAKVERVEPGLIGTP